MWKSLKCSVIMLPTGNSPGEMLVEGYLPQHLYLCSCEPEIKEGDWYYIPQGKPIVFKISATEANTANKSNEKYVFKVIAAADKSLGLPNIPQSFIEEYVSKQGEIKEIVIELEQKCEFDFTARCTQGNCLCEFIPKIDNGGNVIIHSIEPWHENRLSKYYWR